MRLVRNHMYTKQLAGSRQVGDPRPNAGGSYGLCGGCALQIPMVGRHDVGHDTTDARQHRLAIQLNLDSLGHAEESVAKRGTRNRWAQGELGHHEDPLTRSCGR